MGGAVVNYIIRHDNYLFSYVMTIVEYSCHCMKKFF